GASTRQHFINRFLHVRLYITANGFNNGPIASGLRRIDILDVNGRQKDGVPLGRQGERDDWESWSKGDARPLCISSPALRVYFSEDWKYLGAAHRDKGHDRRTMMQCHFYESMATESFQFICVDRKSVV